MRNGERVKERERETFCHPFGCSVQWTKGRLLPWSACTHALAYCLRLVGEGRGRHHHIVHGCFDDDWGLAVRIPSTKHTLSHQPVSCHCHKIYRARCWLPPLDSLISDDASKTISHSTLFYSIPFCSIQVWACAPRQYHYTHYNVVSSRAWPHPSNIQGWSTVSLSYRLVLNIRRHLTFSVGQDDNCRLWECDAIIVLTYLRTNRKSIDILKYHHHHHWTNIRSDSWCDKTGPIDHIQCPFTIHQSLFLVFNSVQSKNILLPMMLVPPDTQLGTSKLLYHINKFCNDRVVYR